MIGRVLENATLYELVQTLAGSRVNDAKMRAILGTIEPGIRILDAGGGTGTVARVFDRGLDYCCMDIDLVRVRVAKAHGSSAVQGDATRMPFADESVDMVVLRAVSHHLGDELFADMVAESWRVLRPSGCMLFLDAIWAPRWLPGRMLWGIDQGSHPRSEAQMRAALGKHFDLERPSTYAVIHRYFMTLARPKAQGAAA